MEAALEWLDRHHMFIRAEESGLPNIEWVLNKARAAAMRCVGWTGPTPCMEPRLCGAWVHCRLPALGAGRVCGRGIRGGAACQGLSASGGEVVPLGRFRAGVAAILMGI